MNTQQLQQQSPQWIRIDSGQNVSVQPNQQRPSAPSGSTELRVTREIVQTKLLSSTDSMSSQASRLEQSAGGMAQQRESRDRLSLSPQAQALQQQAAGQRLSDDELAFIDRLADRDREVRSHEAAHLASAGEYATSSADYTYQQGPNGRQYAVGGEVSIDVSPIADDPEATINKADTIVQAALSPVSPSPQDFKVADQARQMRAQAVRELAIQEMQARQAERSDQDAQTMPAKMEADEPLTDAQQMRTEQQMAEQQQAEDKKVQQQERQQREEAAASEQKMNPQEENNADRMASLNELFARYTEARQAYQAVIDFFTSQYDRSRQASSRTVERFA